MFVANKEVQTVIRNLGGFDVAMTVMQLTANLDDEDEDDDGGAADDMAENAEMENTREILRLCIACSSDRQALLALLGVFGTWSWNEEQSWVRSP